MSAISQWEVGGLWVMEMVIKRMQNAFSITGEIQSVLYYCSCKYKSKSRSESNYNAFVSHETLRLSSNI